MRAGPEKRKYMVSLVAAMPPVQPMAWTMRMPSAAPRPPKTSPVVTTSTTTSTSTKRRCAPMARMVPISFTRWSVAMTMALLMMTSATAKMMRTAR